MHLAGALAAGVIYGIICAAFTRQNDLGNGHKGIAILQQRLDNTRQGLRGVEGSVMEQNNGTRLYLAHHPLGDVPRRQVLPVQTIPIPYSFKLLRPRRPGPYPLRKFSAVSPPFSLLGHCGSACLSSCSAA